MLLEFSISNHKSIRDEVLFSALAGSDKSHNENIVEVAGINVLKSSVIYGANGSGKSNFVNAISFVQNLVVNSINNAPRAGIFYSPHKLDGPSKDTSYHMQFVINQVRYAFGFTLNNYLVSEEYLYYFPNGKQTKIFERKDDSFTSGRSFNRKFTACKDVLKPNRLLLSCAANFSAVEEVMEAYRFFQDQLVVYNPGSQEHWMKYSLHTIYDHPEIKLSILQLFSALGTGIKDIEVEIKKENLDPAHIPSFLSDEFKNLLLQNQVDSISAKVIYDQFETDLISEESSGIRKLFEILCPFLDVMTHGKTLVCDELEINFHEALLFELIRQFIHFKGNQPSQLIFTTHETGLLTLDLFRRDQIWFTEIKQTDRSTDLYSLSEIRNVRKEDNFGKGYIAGKYGAIPMLNLDFASVISDC